jgi:hypothetical protein
VISAARFRDLALSLEGATEVPHFDRAAFRTKRRIFATLPPDGQSANLLLDLDLQEAVCDALPDAFSPVPGGWGRMGYTTVSLRAVTEADLTRVLAEAHARASEPKKKPKAKPAKAALPTLTKKPRAKPAPRR